ncbi:acylneuraminate cytidylyltransferase family protein [Psychrosphaera algicola]|uniref:Acylneuraminate cytidylyltransferase family protein n=1 Tax=Psychrosphaera algicola TaxID=3023714 RepID=A0ABT5FJI3_9GAMM|nr:acylneuraminate cytidylyltransferase family protein [Psychrosphaera sp. G1-22]MDC2891341.1 acylneuraminate cytidylyltransferase family protein [Psychrosphaera sp. G1-22]
MNVALIPARGGSKGLPRKNIISLCGKPLIGWTIEAAKKSNKIDLVYVSTEDMEIAKIAKEHGAKVILRPSEYANDDSTSEVVISHAIDVLELEGLQISTIALLQPTSPLRNELDIDDAFDVYQKYDAQCVLSVMEPEFCAAKAYKLNEDGTITGLLFPDAPYRRRQDLPAALLPNGAIYIIKCSVFKSDSRMPKKEYILF